MTHPSFPLTAYLERIGLPQLPAATPEGLRQLVQAQSRAIAFENLDALAGEPVRVDLDAILDKILGRGRGGYCFELNGLLGAALAAAGFELEPRMARVTYRRPAPGPRTHLLFRVVCGGAAWLVDAGFGGPGPTYPLPWVSGAAFEQDDARFTLVEESDGDLHLLTAEGDGWCSLYRVDSGRIAPSDVEMANHFVSTWPQSPFRRLLMCQMPGEDCSWSFEGGELVRRDRRTQQVERRAVDGPAHLHELLNTVFRLNVPLDIAERAWATVRRFATP